MSNKRPPVTGNCTYEGKLLIGRFPDVLGTDFLIAADERVLQYVAEFYVIRVALVTAEKRERRGDRRQL